MRELLMGNEAIAVGALAAGVQVVAGYPGTPSSEVLETIAKRNPGGVHVEWSVNEKAGAEVAAGAAYSGARSMVTMKQMGLNVASDPVMCVNYIGIKAGMVIYVADDPGPISSQTEQDTRHFGKYARIPVFDCDSPEQAFQAVQDAFAFSEEQGTPVILRSTTRVCHACADIEVPQITSPPPADGFVKDSRWVIFPGLSYRNKQKLVRREQEFAERFARSPHNSIEGTGRIGIACGGISYAYVMEALAGCEERFTVLKIGTPYPFPAPLADRFLEQVDEVYVFEELDPFIEDALVSRIGSIAMEASGADGLPGAPETSSLPGAPDSSGASVPCEAALPDSRKLPRVLGKRTDTVSAAGELSALIVAEVLSRETGICSRLLADGSVPGACSEVSASGSSKDGSMPGARSGGVCSDESGSSNASDPVPVPDLPIRPPVLCAGCPHRGSFYAVKQAVARVIKDLKKSSAADAQARTLPAEGTPEDTPADTADTPRFTQAVYHGDIGCYTLGNAAPLDMVDTCLCMGAGITMAQGMNHSDPNTLNFAFAGDSTFFASGITGTVNAVYNQADMILCILDNSTTAMTGHQPHPGMGITMMGKRVDPIRIDRVLEGIGVPWIRTVDPLDYEASVNTIMEAIGQRGVRAIIFKSPCIALHKKTQVCRIDADRCVGCLRCIREIGCPALSPVLAEHSRGTAEQASDAPDTAALTQGAPAAGSRDRQKALIDPALCNGCTLCAQLCPAGCIETHPLEGTAARSETIQKSAAVPQSDNSGQSDAARQIGKEVCR